MAVCWPPNNPLQANPTLPRNITPTLQPERCLCYGEVPKGYSRTTVSGFGVYTKVQPPLEREWHSDGSKLLVH